MFDCKCQALEFLYKNNYLIINHGNYDSCNKISYFDQNMRRGSVYFRAYTCSDCLRATGGSDE